MPTRPLPPIERVRRRLAVAAGEEVARQLPRGYQRLGRVVLVRWPSSLLDAWGERLGAWAREELGVATVLALEGPAGGEYRRPRVRRLTDGPTETVHQEEGVLWHLDAAELLFSAGNRSERRRAGALVRPGERVADLFAGIGYFTVPAAKFGRPEVVVAVEKNPTSFEYLRRNVATNRVQDRVQALLGDNREVELPRGTFDRVFLGWLPSSLPFVPRALELLRPSGGWLHVHLVVGATGDKARAEEETSRAVHLRGGTVEDARAHRVKAYAPGQSHMVVDVRVRPKA